MTSDATAPPPGSSGTPPPSDEALPRGQCRYILLAPEVRGHRCGCVKFTLNRSTPGSTCDCGHLACFHMASEDAVTDKQEVDKLRRRVVALERQLERGGEGGVGDLDARLGDLEAGIERTREESAQEIKCMYGNISQAWHSFQRMEALMETFGKASRSHEARLASLETRCSTNGGQMRHDERTKDAPPPEGLEASCGAVNATLAQCGTEPAPLLSKSAALTRNYPADHHQRMPGSHPVDPSRQGNPAPLALRLPSHVTHEPWTVHISLLPDASQPFPFERDTNAYKRCLSRGLQRMVVVSGTSAEAFEMAVAKTFGKLLRGRPWMPLQARLCDAEQLSGLPMLRPLDAKARDCRYDFDFLRSHCAVCDSSGKMESLYIAMQSDTLSWRFLRESPVYIDGLEACWVHDPVLDHSEQPLFSDGHDDRRQPAGGDGNPLKRAASDMLKASAVAASGAAGDGDGSRKMQNTSCKTGVMDLQRRLERV